MKTVLIIPCSFGQVSVLLNKEPQLDEHTFDGRKITHPFLTKTEKKEVKGREVSDMFYDQSGQFVSDEVEKAIQDPSAVFQLKWDGTSTQLRQDTDGSWTMLHSLDIHWNQKQNAFPTPPPNAIPSGPEPINAGPGWHWKHMMPCDVGADVKREGENALQYRPTFERFLESPWFRTNHSKYNGRVIGCETMGSWLAGRSDPVPTESEKVQKGKTRYRGVIMPFGTIQFKFPEGVKITYDILAEFFSLVPNIEGFVVYTTIGIFKIRRELFINKFGAHMSFGRKEPNQMQMLPEVKEFLEAHGSANFAEYVTKALGLIP
jgi:hypothetical protein